jgi:hypothetical protein
LTAADQLEPVEAPVVFSAAVASLDQARLHPDAAVHESPAPGRIAPWAAARSLELGDPATGRLVYLHDPAGQPAWAGCDRLVAFLRVDVDAVMAADPMLSDVVWDWLLESLADHGAGASALGGTVTTTASKRYGSLTHLDPTHEVELRCSWTPASTASGPELGPHLGALVATMAAMCGLPPTTVELSAR